MKAIVYTRYGPPDGLRLEEVERPIPRHDEVLIRVRAVAINDWDWGLLHGTPFSNRAANGLLKPRKQILGSDVAGRIEAVGSGVTRFRLGDEVFGDLSGRWGGFAEYVCAREAALTAKPEGMTFVEAASLPQAGTLAFQGLVERGDIRSGQKLLINGAGGGVGTFAIQIAKLHGADVTGVDSGGKLGLLRSLGFDRVIDYKRGDFTKQGQQYDLILDLKTNRSLFRYLRVLHPRGSYVTVGGSTGRLIQAALLGPLVSLFTGKRARLVILKENKGLAYLCELFEAGKLKPVIDGPYRLSELPEAMRYFGEGKHKGKVVITLEGEA